MNKTASILCRKQLKKAQASDEPPLKTPSLAPSEASAPSSRRQLPAYNPHSPPTVGERVAGLANAVPQVIRGLHDASRRAESRIPGTEGFRQLPLRERLDIADKKARPAGAHAGDERLHAFFDRVPHELEDEAERQHLGRAYPSTAMSMIQAIYGAENQVPERLWRDYSSAVRADEGTLGPEILRDAIGLPAHDLPLATGPIAGHLTGRNIGTVTDVAAAAMQRNPLGLLSALLRQSQSYGPESYGKGDLREPPQPPPPSPPLTDEPDTDWQHYTPIEE